VFVVSIYNKKILKWGVVVVASVAFLVFTNPIFAEESIEPYLIEGYSQVSGTGTFFRVNVNDDSVIDIKTQVPVELKIDTSEKMIVIENESSDIRATTFVTISGLHPLTTYYKYIDSYLNIEEIKTDANGSLTYEQDISNFHFVFIQLKKVLNLLALRLPEDPSQMKK